jgi:hypothetical protein
MAASIAAVAIPIAAAGAYAAKTVGTVLGSFSSSLMGQANEPTKAPDASQIADPQILKDKVNRFQQQLASRIRNSGVATEAKIEVQLDEFGLLRAYSQGKENIDLSRWLSSESDLTSTFAALQTKSGELGEAAKMTLQVDLTPANV